MWILYRRRTEGLGIRSSQHATLAALILPRVVDRVVIAKWVYRRNGLTGVIGLKRRSGNPSPSAGSGAKTASATAIRTAEFRRGRCGWRCGRDRWWPGNSP